MISTNARRSQSPRQYLRAAARFCTPLAVVIAFLAMVGCARHKRPAISTQPITAELEAPRYVETLEATVTPPSGWKLDKDKNEAEHSHQVWISPTGKTAFGVILFHMPLPVGHEWALWGFLREMKKNEGTAEVIDKKWDEDLGALRFVAQGGRYTVRTILRVSGFDGLAIYAGTLTGQPVDETELRIAEDARERSFWGK